MSRFNTTLICPACLKEPARCQCHAPCDECGCITNHTTKQHQAAMRSEDDVWCASCCDNLVKAPGGVCEECLTDAAESREGA